MKRRRRRLSTATMVVGAGAIVFAGYVGWIMVKVLTGGFEDAK